MGFITTNIFPSKNTVIGVNPTTNTGIFLDIFGGSYGGSYSSGVDLSKGIVTTTPETQPPTNTGSGTDTGGTVPANGTVTPNDERLLVLERIRQSSDLDPAAKIRIQKLAASRSELTAQNLRVIFATCLYPSAQGLPAPEGYEYFLTLLEKGQTVEASLSDSRLKFNADKAQSSPSDPNAPDSQETLVTQGRIVVIAIAAFVVLILLNR